MKSRIKLFSRIGSIFYILWGLLNIFAAVLLLQYSSEGNMKDYLYNTAPLVNSDRHVSLSSNRAVLGLAGFHAFNYLWIGLLSIAVAIRLNWKNDATGFWINAALGISINLGFIFFHYANGIMPVANGIPVILLFLVGLGFTGLALYQKENTASDLILDQTT